MKTILQATVLNPFRSHVPKGFYDPIKGHTGVDLDFVFESIPCPCDLEILLNNKQTEMGNVTYAKDHKGYIHVFAHQKDFVYKVGDSVLKGKILGYSANTGAKTTAPHLHYEILAPKGTNPTMKRLLLSYEGDNIDPLEYLKSLESQTTVISDVEKTAILDRARENRLKRGISWIASKLFSKP